VPAAPRFSVNSLTKFLRNRWCRLSRKTRYKSCGSNHEHFCKRTSDKISRAKPGMRFIFPLVCCLLCADVADAQFSFFDDFSRGQTNNPLSPWTVGIGIWHVANGVMQGTGSSAQDYSDCYVPGNWTNFTIQGRIQLP